MSEVEVPRSPVEAALSRKSELEAYDRDGDHRVLLGALKEQVLLNRYVAASQAENNRKLALQTLFNRLEHMSDKMLLKTIRKLGKMGAPTKRRAPRRKRWSTARPRRATT